MTLMDEILYCYIDRSLQIVAPSATGKEVQKMAPSMMVYFAKPPIQASELLWLMEGACADRTVFY